MGDVCFLCCKGETNLACFSHLIQVIDTHTYIYIYAYMHGGKELLGLFPE